VWKYIFRIFRSQSSFRVMDTRSRSWQWKLVVCESKTTGQKLMELDQSDLATSFVVWRYTLTMYGSPSNFKVMELMSKLRQQKRQCPGLCCPQAQFNFIFHLQTVIAAWMSSLGGECCCEFKKLCSLFFLFHKRKYQTHCRHGNVKWSLSSDTDGMSVYLVGWV